MNSNLSTNIYSEDSKTSIIELVITKARFHQSNFEIKFIYSCKNLRFQTIHIFPMTYINGFQFKFYYLAIDKFKRMNSLIANITVFAQLNKWLKCFLKDYSRWNNTFYKKVFIVDQATIKGAKTQLWSPHFSRLLVLTRNKNRYAPRAYIWFLLFW